MTSEIKRITQDPHSVQNTAKWLNTPEGQEQLNRHINLAKNFSEELKKSHDFEPDDLLDEMK